MKYRKQNPSWFTVVVALAIFVAAMYGVSWILFALTTHTLAVLAVFLLIFNGKSSK